MTNNFALAKVNAMCGAAAGAGHDFLEWVMGDEYETDAGRTEETLPPAPFTFADLVNAFVALPLRGLAQGWTQGFDCLHSALVMHAVWRTEKALRRRDRENFIQDTALDIERVIGGK